MNITGKRIIQKILAVLVILTMTMAEFTMVGVNLVSYAADLVKINNENVGFNVYFQDESRALETTATVDKGDLKLAIEVNVKKDGYLADGKIELEETSNFKFKSGLSNNYVKNVEDKVIYLNQINEGETAIIEVGVEFVDSQEFDIDYLNRKSTISLLGNYVNSKNVEKQQRIEIDGSAELRVDWKSPEKLETILDAKLLTNTVYNIDSSNKRVVQLLISSKLENNSYPVKNTNIELDVPGNPETVTVHKRMTNATNGNAEFAENNYQYKDNKLMINIENGQNNKISWKKNTSDTVVVTFTYPEDAEIDDSQISVNSTLLTYDDKKASNSTQVSLDKNIETIASGEQAQSVNEIAKGNLYIGKDKEYSTYTRLYVDYAKSLTEILVQEQETVFVAANEEKAANVEYIQTIINKDQFIKIFGESGIIDVKDQNGNIVTTITKDTEVNEDGNIVVKYNSGITSISLSTSKPETEGILSIRDDKKILNTGYSRKQINDLEKIKDSNKITYTKNDESKISNDSYAEANLKETESKATFLIEPKTLSTNQEEQEMHMRVILESDSEYKDLYKNANIKIDLPKQINGVSAEGSLLYGNGLRLANFEVTTEDDQMHIIAKLDGEQTSYSGEAAKGVTLDIIAKVTLNRLATNSNEEIKLSYRNENAKVYTDNGEETVKVEIVSQDSMILTNDIDEYGVTTTGKQEDKTVSLDINGKEKTAKVKMQVANNEESDISNVSILGKIADVSGKIERTSNIGIGGVDGATVYYTTVENPSTNITDSKNGWTKETTKNATNYLIVVDKMRSGEKINFSYDIKMAEKLSYNITTETGYSVSYTNDLTGKQKNVESTKLVLTTGSVAELKLGLTAEVGGQEIKEGDTVKAGEIITYKVSLSNVGREKAEDVELVATIPQNTTLLEVNSNYSVDTQSTGEYQEDDSFDTYYNEKDNKQLSKNDITLEPNKTVTYTFMAKVNSDFVNDTEGEAKVSAKYGNIEENATLKNKLVPGVMAVSIRIPNTKNSDNLIAGYDYSYAVNIQNLTDKELKNVQVTINKNDLINVRGIEYVVGGEYKELSGDNLTFTIDSIPANSTLEDIGINVKIGLPSSNLQQAEMMIEVKDANGNSYKSNKLEKKVTGVETKTELKVSSSGDTENGYIHPGDEVRYEIKVKNVGTMDAEDLTIQDHFSDYLELNSIKLNGKDCEYEENDNYEDGATYSTLNIKAPLKVNEEVTVEISAKVSKSISTTDLLKAINKVYVVSGGMIVGESEENTLYIETVFETIEIGDPEEPTNPTEPTNPEQPTNPTNPEEPTNPQDPQKPEEVKRYAISGKVWLDKDQNGSKDSGDSLMEGIKVYAVDVSTNTIAKDANNSEIITTTANDGTYTLANIPEGEYIVAFEYNTEKYVVTLYQQKGVSADKNSDAVTATTNINGEEKTLAITDSIKLTKSTGNINLGLVEAKVFDLDLKKVVSKMVVTNSEGTKTYEYDDVELAKLEIRSKNLSNSTVVIEYKMKITNKGEAAGYVKNIVDYIPSSLTFSSSVNTDWYQKGNYIYNSSLANTKIEPGQTKEVTLVLTKAMTESNTGLTNNRAEIESAYTSLGVQDKNSTPGNNKDGEDDIGSANVLITPSTGEAVSYVALTLTLIVLICGAAYLINKKILIKRIKI